MDVDVTIDEAVKGLAGAYIKCVEVENSYGRSRTLVLHLDDDRVCRVSYWAEHEQDGSLEVEWTAERG